MNPELQRFSATFFAESYEGLEVIETGLLALDQATDEGEVSPETVHTIFRAAHSLKGGAATFGFTAIAELTHGLETVLDELRTGKSVLERDTVDTLLAVVDQLRHWLQLAEHDQRPDPSAVKTMIQRLQGAFDHANKVNVAATSPPVAQAQSPVQAMQSWQIRFIPKPTLFINGNDPLHSLRELHSLGELKVQVDLHALPDFEQLDPLQSYLRWDMQLSAAVPRERIEDVFAWVSDECEWHIAPARPPQLAIPELKTDLITTENAHSIRVSVDKVDTLVNLVGELVITQSMLQQITGELAAPPTERLTAALERLERNTRDLRDAVISTRMLPVKSVFQRFPRLLRNLAAQLGKQVRLRTSGENTELDRGMIEKITDPLAHLLRNAIDHGIETPLQRSQAGKAPTGTITLSATQQNGHIVIEMSDDGAGLNRQKILHKAVACGLDIPPNPSDNQVWDLIFSPGFSTVDQVTEVSGRGVGMDVVRRNIQALGGQVHLRSISGQGTHITIHLPLTLAMVEGMVVSVAEQTLILPLPHITEVLQPSAVRVVAMAGHGRAVQLRGQYLPVVSLRQYYRYPESKHKNSGLLVAVKAGEQHVALEVDELLGQQQVVIKNIQANYRPIQGISAATVLGDGRVALIADISALASAH